VSDCLKIVLLVFATSTISTAQEPSSAVEFSARRAAFYSQIYNVPEELVDAIIQVESGWNPYAVSNKGAAGLMQLMPQTAIRFGVHDRFDIEQNLRGGVAYLAWLIRLFNGDLRLAVGAYQAGESRILVRGLGYSSPVVFDYVQRVAQLYREIRRARHLRVAGSMG
jgi:soluble lytic murein transglycosylase-like protein